MVGNVAGCSVAARIVMDVSCVRGMKHECHFARQAQYLVMLECDWFCSEQCNGHFTCEDD